MRIGILGAGNMGRAIGLRAASLGHELMFGARRSEQARKAAALADAEARTGSIAEAAEFGEVVLWTMREIDPTSVLDDASSLDGKLVLDPNNRDYAREVAPGRLPGRSLGEMLQAALPNAKVVKCFTTIPMETFNCSPQELRLAGAQTFIAGDDADAKRKAVALIGQLGFLCIDLGSGPVAFRSAEALGDCVRHLMIDGHMPLAHLRLGVLPTAGSILIGARVAGQYT
jgi:predicted dinucleotide-binding enzyme